MKTIAKILILLPLVSCGKYVSLTRENYEVLNRSGNVLKISAKFERPIELEYLEPDTVIATVDNGGTCNFNTVRRVVAPIPGGAKVRIKDARQDMFTAEFVDYKLSLPMVRTTSDGYVILTSRENIVANTRYVVKDSDPNIMIRIKNSKSKQNISLKK